MVWMTTEPIIVGCKLAWVETHRGLSHFMRMLKTEVIMQISFIINI